MENSIYVVGALIALAGIVSSVLFSVGHRDSGLWVSCVAATLVVVAGFMWFQDRLWKQDDDNRNVAAIKAQQSVTADAYLVPGDRDASDVLEPDIASQLPPRTGQRVEVILGNSVISISQFPHVVIEQAGEDMLVLNVDGGKLLVSAKFFSEQGKILGEIVRNKFYLNPDEYFRVERTATKLTVFDKEARMVLAIEFMGPALIRILGDFYLRNATRISIGPEKQQFGKQIWSGNFFGDSMNYIHLQ